MEYAFYDNSVENRYCFLSDSPLEAIYNWGNHHYKNNKEIITQMSSPVNNSTPGRPSRPAWYQSIAKFENPNILKSSWQIVNTLIPYFFLWYVMVRAMQAGYSYWVILLLTVPAGLFMVRLFILFHDCTHQSFFSSKRANQIFGYISGVLTFAAYEKWRAAHWRRHATVADLD